MSVFELYDTGGNLVFPVDATTTAAHQSLVQSLVDSSFVDVYYDPPNRRLAHRFRAQYRRSGRGYRWQDFYAVYQPVSPLGPQSVSELARLIRAVFKSDRWEPYRTPTPLDDDADPRYIDRLSAHADGGAVRLPGIEQRLYEHLRDGDWMLEIGMSTHQKAIDLLGVLLECTAPIVVGSNVDRSRLANYGLLIEYGVHDDFEPLTARTRRLLVGEEESPGASQTVHSRLSLQSLKMLVATLVVIVLLLILFALVYPELSRGLFDAVRSLLDILLSSLSVRLMGS